MANAGEPLIKTHDIVDNSWNFAFKFTIQNNFSVESCTDFIFAAKLLVRWVDGAGIIDIMVRCKYLLSWRKDRQTSFWSDMLSYLIWSGVASLMSGGTLEVVNTLRPRQNCRHFADDTFRCFFMNEKNCILIRISLKFVPKDPIDCSPAFVQIMAWRRTGTIHWRICGTRGRCVN